MNVLSLLDFILFPFVFLIIYLSARSTKNKTIESNPSYKYYVKGIVYKMLSGIAFCLIYSLYYDGGDTVNYFRGAVSMANLITDDFGKFWDLFTKGNRAELYYYFTDKTGYPEVYMFRDKNSFFVIRFMSMIVFFCGKCYITSTLILDWIAYKGIWKLYLFFTNFYPKLSKEFAWSVLFIPSVLFWGSGIMKDTITLSASCWFIYSLFMITVKRTNLLRNIVSVVITSFVIMAIKPYIFVALMPGTVMWVFFDRVRSIQNPIIRVMAFPFILSIGFVIVTFVFSNISEQLGAFSSVDKMVAKAKLTQEDLTRSAQYGNNYYDIGKIDNSYSGLFGKAPQAIVAGLFRPFLWEVRNPVMLLSGLENMAMAIFTIVMLFRLKLIGFIRTIFEEPLILFSFTFSFFFAFGIGLSSTNFGALVRYKIPSLPFYVATLFIMNYIYNGKKKEAKQELELATQNKG